MVKIDEGRINKVLTIIIIILTLFILGCAYYLKEIRQQEQEELLNLIESKENKENGVAEVVYKKEVFGEEFDFEYLDETTLLDEYNGLKFIRFDNIYFVINEEKTLECEYIFDVEKNDYNYRYCTIKDDNDNEYKIDFSNFKFVKNDD